MWATPFILSLVMCDINRKATVNFVVMPCADNTESSTVVFLFIYEIMLIVPKIITVNNPLIMSINIYALLLKRC